MKIAQGFTLIELMLATALGLITLLGIFTLVENARDNYRYIQAIMVLEENGQLMDSILRQQLSQAGFTPCRKLDDQFSINPHNIPINYTATSAIHGYINATIKTIAADIAKKMRENTDAIHMYTMNTQTQTLLRPANSGDTVLYTQMNLPLKTGTILMIADCDRGELNTVEKPAKNGDKQLHVRPLSQNYIAGAEVGELVSALFYIGATSRQNKSGTPIYALYRQDITGRDEELIDGIEQFQILYGSQKPTLKFQPAAAVTHWENIHWVLIKALLVSNEPVLRQPQLVHFAQQQWKAPDRRLYKEWDTLVQLPNR